jgi:hypothetical protein
MAEVPPNVFTSGIKFGINARLNVAGLNRQLERYYKNVRSAEPRVRRANQAAVQWLSDHAQQELQERIATTGRSQEEPNNLVRIVGDPSIHSKATGTNFQFFIPAKVNKTPVRRYWRNLEEGTRLFVERSEATGRGLIFLGGPDGKLIRAGANRLAGSSQVALAGRGRRGALIRRPIPAYHYLQSAVAQFEYQHIYRDLLRKEFAGTPIKFR